MSNEVKALMYDNDEYVDESIRRFREYGLLVDGDNEPKASFGQAQQRYIGENIRKYCTKPRQDRFLDGIR